MRKKIVFLIPILIFWLSCAKQDAFNTPDSSLFESKYCNDPEAINYNHGFPGTPDNSVCIYAKDIFSGTYTLSDSIYNSQFELDTVLEYTISINAPTNNELKLTGFCGTGEFSLTADRFYKASLDSTLLADTTKLDGQFACRTVDTITGNIAKNQSDSTLLRINWTINSDTGINFHIGTATKK